MITQKYQQWSKILIEPQTMNAARLYSLEKRLYEEENLRMKEFLIIKDYYLKLLYTL